MTTIDLITCDIRGEIKDKIDLFNNSNEYNITIQYSLDATGNYSNGGDWILESHNEDIKTV